VRKKINFFISWQQNKKLEDAINRTGMTISELFRRALDYYLKSEEFDDK